MNKVKDKRDFNPNQLNEARVARGLTIKELAEAISVTKQAVSQYELGISIPKPEVMMSICKTLEMPRAFFYDEDDDEVKGNTFFRASTTISKKVREMQRKRVNWLYRIHSYLDKYVDFPELNLPNTTCLAEEEWDKDSIEELSVLVRNHWKLGDKPITNMVNLLENNGIVVASLQLGNEKIDAFCQPRSANYYILLGEDKQVAVRRQFDAAHELGHLLMHHDIDNQDKLTKEEFKVMEQQANQFASSLLLPEDAFRSLVASSFTLDDYKELKKYWRVSISAMIMRAKDLGIISESRYTSLQKQISMKKWRQKEPLDDVLPVPSPTALRKAVLALLESGLKDELQIAFELKLNSNDIEMLCNLESGTLSVKEVEPVIKLKNFVIDSVENWK